MARRSVLLVARRLILALAVAGLVAAALRVRGKGGAPAQQGGWEELSFEQKP